MNIDELYPVRALIPPVNRQAQRAIMQEYAKVAMSLLKVESDFYSDLFNNDEILEPTYLDLYNFYQERYLRTVDYLERSKKLKAITINRTYFHDMMYPIETPTA